jgi:hypothetical protein
LPEAYFGGDPNQFGLENGEHCLLTTFDIVEIDHYDNELIFCQPKPLMAYVTSEPAVKQALVGPKLEAFRQFIAETLIDRHEIRVTTEKGLFRSIKGSA